MDFILIVEMEGPTYELLSRRSLSAMGVGENDSKFWNLMYAESERFTLTKTTLTIFNTFNLSCSASIFDLLRFL